MHTHGENLTKSPGGRTLKRLHDGISRAAPFGRPLFSPCLRSYVSLLSLLFALVAVVQGEWFEAEVEEVEPGGKRPGGPHCSL